MEPGTGEKKTEAFSVQDVTSSPVPEQLDPSSQLWKQTRTRRLFSASQLFAFTLVYFIAWVAVAGNMYFAMQNGGPAAWLFSYFYVIPGVFCQVASFAEIASIMPVAGAQYYWTHYYAPPNLKLFLTWIQGWSTWVGYVSMLTAVITSGVLWMEGILALNYETYEAGGWRTTLIILGIILLIMVVNMWLFFVVPWFELAAGILNFVLFIVVLVLLWSLAPRNSLDVFLIKNVSTGWDHNYFVSFNLGAASNAFLFLAFESMIHMGEETRNPKRAVPQALFWGVIANMVIAFVMLITFGVCMPSVQTLLDSVSPIVTIIHYGTGSLAATTAVISMLFFLNIATSLGMLSSVSRLTWAWSRDGGLPVYFAMVDGKTRVPLRAILGTSFLGACLALLNLSGEAYIAFNAIASLTSIATFTSYAIALLCFIWARFQPGGIELGEWNWGRFGIVFNVLALVYTVYELIWFPFPNVLPVTATNMNYAGPIYLLVLLIIVSWWFLRARHTWKGPNMRVMEIVLRNETSK